MRLPEYRKRFRVLYKELAQKCDCTPEMISLIATEKTRPSLDLAFKIEKATDGWVSHENWYRLPRRKPTATIVVSGTSL
jgi:DNA-binding XRE family transcriptional regulator